MYVARFAAGSARRRAGVAASSASSAGEVASAGASSPPPQIAGLPTEQLDPVRVLAAAVPRALALPPLDAARAHRDPRRAAGDGPLTEPEEAPEAL